MLGKIKGRRRRGHQRRRWLDGITDATDVNLGKLRESEGQGGLACCSPWGDKESGTTGRNNNTTTVFRKNMFGKITSALCKSQQQAT